MKKNERSADFLAAILRDGIPRTKSELAKMTGRARSTISVRLEELVDEGFVVQLDRTESTKGRPSALFGLDPQSRLIAAVDLGANHGVFAITDLVGGILGHRTVPLDIADGPVKVLDQAVEILTEILDSLGRSTDDLLGLGMGLPGPVEHDTGLPTSPPIMPGWDRYDVQAHIRDAFGVRSTIDNDVNIMAVGEMVGGAEEDSDNILMVKIATGIGAGIIADGRLVRGADGAGGDIGHIQVAAGAGRMCRCGQEACLEAVASGSGIAGTLTEMGIEAKDAVDVVALVRGGDLEATRVVREAGRIIGRVLAGAICLLNPSLIVIGGEMAQVGEPLLAGIREVVYQRSQPLATKHLRIVTATNNEFGGIVGASRLIQDHVFGMTTTR